MHVPDQNLQLAILEGLVRDGTLPLPADDLRDTDDYEASPAIRAYWQNQWEQVNPQQVTQVIWNEAPDVQQSIWPYFDGEDDVFDIKSLDGIDTFPNITSVEIAFLAHITDVSPLTRLPQLKSLWLQEAVQDTPANRSVIETLIGNGVDVRINGQSEWPETQPATHATSVPTPNPSPRAAKPTVAPERFPAFERHYRCTPTEGSSFVQVMIAWTEARSALLDTPLNLPQEPTVTLEELPDGQRARSIIHHTANNVTVQLQLTQRRWLDGAPSATEANLRLTITNPSSVEHALKLTAYAEAHPGHLDYLILSGRNIAPEQRHEIEQALQDDAEAQPIRSED